MVKLFITLKILIKLKDFLKYNNNNNNNIIYIII